MAELSTKLDNHARHIWPCDCGDWHYLELVWDDADPTWRFLELVDTYGSETLRGRIKAAAKVLRGGSHVHRGVLLDEPTVAEVLAVLSKHAAGSQEVRHA